MELEKPTNGENQQASEYACYGEAADPSQPGCFLDDVDSTCSTPYVSAPSSPGRGGLGGYFFSAPASPMHFVLSSSPYTCGGVGDGGASGGADGLVLGSSFEFEFSARFSGTAAGTAAAGSMISADELFLNGQIRPMNLSSHLQRPQVLAPLLDLEGEDEDEDGNGDHEGAAVRGRDLKMRNRSLRRRARSMSPLRNAPFQWHDEEEEEERSGERGGAGKGQDGDLEADPDMHQAAATTPSVSASSSRSSSTSSSRNSKRWVFLKDLLYRSKSEGRGNAKEKFWNAISFSPSKEKSSSFFFRDRFKPATYAAPPPSGTPSAASPATSESQKTKQKCTQTSSVASSASASTSKKASSASPKPTNRVGKRRGASQSPHERHYTANRAQAEEMRKKTFLPYRQGLLGCLWFSSRSYGAMNGFTRTLNPVSSR